MKTFVLGVGIVVLGFVGWYVWSTSEVVVPGSGEATERVSTVELAMLDYGGPDSASGGVVRGCDRVVFVTAEVSSTNDPLTVAMEQLFAYEEETIEGWGNFMPRTTDTLAFERAEVAEGLASVYLTGSLSGLAGVCDNPRVKTQIEETALRLPNVVSVDIYLNGTLTELMPNEQ